MKANNIFFIMTFLFLSCGRLDPQPAQPDQNIEQINNFSTYVLDQNAGGLFEQEQTWYTYYAIEQQILSNLDVYAIRAKNRYYKIQIVEVYPLDDLDNQNKLGAFLIRLDAGAGTSIIEFDASGCGIGAPGQSNPCLGTDQDIFTYLDLATLRIWKMSDDEAKESLEWDIAFKLSEIKLNSGLSGPGNVAGAIVSRDSRYLDEETGVAALLEARASGSDLARFEQSYNLSEQFYFGPDGIKRVIYESQWFDESEDGVRTAKPTNWWIIRHQNNLGFSKLSISNIETSGQQSIITFLIHTQDSNDNSFPLLPTPLSLTIDNSALSISCLDFNNGARVVDCRGESNLWDVRFVNRRGQWQIGTSNGARGPLSQDVVATITKG